MYRDIELIIDRRATVGKGTLAVHKSDGNDPLEATTVSTCNEPVVTGETVANEVCSKAKDNDRYDAMGNSRVLTGHAASEDGKVAAIL